MTGEPSPGPEASPVPRLPGRLVDLLGVPASIGVDELRTVLGLAGAGGVGSR